ncbi:MAG TPA: hypothetical protein VFW66_14210 [Gemmatimonadales bacterium]|nr:hypothetical protein [Gemmatimonadales bacterium]
MMDIGRTAQVAAALSRHGRAKRSAVEAWQADRLRRVIAHAYARVPHYRALFDRYGVRPEQIRGVADLARIPITNKPDLARAAPAEVVARGYSPDRLIPQITSGTSGQRITLYRTWLEIRLQHLFRLRALRSVGVRARDVTASIGLTHEVHGRDHKTIGRTLRALGRYRRVRLDVFTPPEVLAEQLRACAPDVVSGYPGTIARAAAHLLDNGGRAVRPRLVLVGAEVLTPAMRHSIESAFAAPAFDMYGSHEFGLLGWQCAATGAKHIPDDSIVLEVLKDGRPAEEGETGEVVVTALHRYAMPLIRYRLGDLATRGPAVCTCGAPWSTIGEIQGRTMDFFTLPGGRVLHPYELFVAMLYHDGLPVRQYEFVQERGDRVVIRLVLAPGWDGCALRAAEDRTRAVLGPDVELGVEVVDQIAPGPNGKFRAIRREAADGAAPGVAMSAPERA